MFTHLELSCSPSPPARPNSLPPLLPFADRRVRLNLSWSRALNPNEDERRSRYRVVVGHDQLVAPSRVTVADYLREKQGVRKEDANIMEATLRHQAISLQVGFGSC